jgi:antitoxin component YwqK of YwqJK toxin-antitoxin module
MGSAMNRRHAMSKTFAALTVSILALTPGCDNKPREATYKELKWKDDLYYLNEALFTGIARDIYSDGKPRAEYPMRKGQLHGVVKEWWDNGQLSTETHFEKGKRHGLNRYWQKDGQQWKEQVYEHGESKSVKILIEQAKK